MHCAPGRREAKPPRQPISAALYAHGWKVPRDPVEAMHWLTQAATLKNRTGQRELGLLLLRGDGVARDPDRAVALLKQAAEAGDAVAAAALGVACASGDGVPQSWTDAVKWTRKAASEAGNARGADQPGDHR